MKNQTQKETLALDVIQPDVTTKSVVDEVAETVDPVMDQKAEENVAKLLDFKSDDVEKQELIKASVAAIGVELEQENARMSPILKTTIKEVNQTEDGGEVAQALANLKIQVEELDPAKFDFSEGWVSRTLGFLPFVGKPLKRYFTRYETAQTVISSIMGSLEKGKEQLDKDNKNLIEDQKRMRALTVKLQKAIKLVQVMDDKVSYKLSRDYTAGSDEHGFVEEQVLFPLRQRIMDLQQTLAVNQQGVVALDVIIANNKELIKGAERTKNVTVNALNVAVTVAVALANQKVVLDKIDGITNTTNNLIKGTAARLKQQGAEIHKRASTAALDMEALKSAFADVHSAMNDISNYRKAALPKMAATIKEMDKMTSSAEEKIREMEKGKKVREKVIDLDA